MIKRFGLFLFCLCVGCGAREPVPNVADIQRARELVDQGTIALLDRDLNMAEASYRMALSLAWLPQARDGLGCVSFARGDLGQAASVFRELNRLEPEYASAYANLGRTLELQGYKEAAKRAYFRAIQLKPDSGMARNNLAAHLYDSARPAEAIAELLMASTVYDHPLIQGNIITLQEKKNE